MSAKQSKQLQKFFKSPIIPGQAISTAGVSAGLNNLARALEQLEIDVKATGLTGRIDWRNGIPRIIIEDAT